MKNRSFSAAGSFSARNFVRSTAVALLLSSSVLTANANGNENEPGLGNAAVSHVSSDQKSQLFEVKVENAEGEKFMVVVKDAQGVIYRNVFAGKNFTRKFRIPKTDSDKLVFVVKSLKSKDSETFEVNSSVRLVEEVVVTRR